MKAEVGMYVRIKNKVGYCVIGKIENINDYREPMMKYCIDIQSDDFIFVPEEMIFKSSNNIIDLVEVGDYVNGFKVVGWTPSKIITNEPVLDYNTIIIENTYLEYDDIKSIVTKEQFESMQYKVDYKGYRV